MRNGFDDYALASWGRQADGAYYAEFWMHWSRSRMTARTFPELKEALARMGLEPRETLHYDRGKEVWS